MTEKESQALDSLYAQFVEKTAEPAGIVQQQIIGPASDFTKNYIGIPLWRALLMTGLGTGALGAHYMYNRTKDTSQSRNLQRAQKPALGLRRYKKLRGLTRQSWTPYPPPRSKPRVRLCRAFCRHQVYSRRHRNPHNIAHLATCRGYETTFSITLCRVLKV